MRLEGRVVGKEQGMKRILRKIHWFLVVFAGFVGVTGCSNTATRDTTYSPREDQKLIVYTSHKKEVYGPIVKEFEERTGIWVQVKDGGTNELLEQLKELSGSSTCDVMFGGGVENLDAYEDYFEPYICKENEVLDQTFVSEKQCWGAFSALPIVLIYNNKLVYETAAPTGWADLLEERWRGKVAFADPNTSGSSYTALATMVQVLKEKTPDCLEQFAYILDGNVLSGSGDVIDAVVKGTRLVGITLEETALKKIAAGADITMVYPIEGTSAVPDGSALIKNAPHAENAKLFLDFIVSKETQQFIVDKYYRRSIRNDIKGSINQDSEIVVIPYDLEWASSNQNDLLKRWSDLIE